MHVIAQQKFLEDTERSHQQEGVSVEQQDIQLSAQRSLGAAELSHEQQQRADADHQHAEDQQHVGRAENLYVEAVSVVPPVVEGRGGDHGHAAPGTDECAERSAEAPHPHRARLLRRGGMAEGAGEDEIPARDARQDAAQIDQHVGGGPEGIAADALVPRDIPDSTDGGGGDGDDAVGDVPGDGGRACGGVVRPRDGCALSHRSSLTQGEAGDTGTRRGGERATRRRASW